MLTSWFLLAVTWVCAAASDIDWDTWTPLDEYVWRDDGAFEFHQHDHFERFGVDCYILNMTSQKWKDESWTHQPFWWHFLVVYIPKTIRFTDAGMLFIGGGRNTSPNPPDPDRDTFFDMILKFSNMTGAVGGYLRHVPNQPLRFTDDPAQRNRTEDDQIAYTWRKFIDTNGSDPEILSRMPMTKAGVKAMDAMRDFAQSKNPAVNLTEFLVGGGSKRGWTAWTVACTDKRVFALAPMSMDLLNFTESLHHHYQAYGGWSWVFKDYYNENVTKYLTDPRTEDMAKIIDPFAYRKRLTMPKMIILAVGDEFFLLDDSHYYYDAMEGETRMMLCDNSNHALVFHHERLNENMASFFISIKTGHQRPEVTWTREETATSGSITATASQTPYNVTAWMAETDKNITMGRRDFRWVSNNATQPIIWFSYEVEDLGNNVYKREFDKVDDEWVAFFLLLEFDGPEGRVLEFTTEVQIIPDTFPFPRCEGEDCRGTLV